jgi:ArsR family transcriptional regulator
MEIQDAVAGLSALGHEGRLAIFRLLVVAGPEGVASGEIARRLHSPPSTMTANLNIMAHAGLVLSRREGRSILYSANYPAMGQLLAYLMQDCCGGRPEVCAPLVEIAATACCAVPAGSV